MKVSTKSLRARLLAWYVASIVLVVTLVGVAVCWVTWQSRLAAIDSELGERADQVARAVRPRAGGAFDVELSSDATGFFQQSQPRPYYAVWSGDGLLVDRSDPELAFAVPPAAGVRTRGPGREVIVSARDLTVLVGRDIGDVRDELWSLAGTIALVASGAVAIALGLAWFLAGRALAPVQRINDTARRMAAGDLTARITVERTETDLDQVASALNLAFDRLLESIERQRRFTADASHQLRTPVATLMAEVEWVLLRARTAEEYHEALETCRRAGTRMRSLVEGLLTLARADSGELPLSRERVALDGIVEQALESLRPLAQERRVTLSCSSVPSAIAGDCHRLTQLVTNLLFNAIIYNQAGGRVSIALRMEGPEAVLRVRDTGIGIGAEDLPRIFDRFYRGEAGRAREPAGAGLGLAVAKWIADAHGASLACASEPGRWTEFVARFPPVGLDIFYRLSLET